MRDSRHKSIIIMKANREKQVQIYYVKPEVELVDINISGVICAMSGEISGQDPNAPIEAH